MCIWSWKVSTLQLFFRIFYKYIWKNTQIYSKKILLFRINCKETVLNLKNFKHIIWGVVDNSLNRVLGIATPLINYSYILN